MLGLLTNGALLDEVFHIHFHAFPGKELFESVISDSNA